MSNLIAMAYEDEATAHEVAATQPGGAALFVLVREPTPDEVLPHICRYRGEVVHTSPGTEADEALQAALGEGARAPA